MNISTTSTIHFAVNDPPNLTATVKNRVIDPSLRKTLIILGVIGAIIFFGALVVFTSPTILEHFEIDIGWGLLGMMILYAILFVFALSMYKLRGKVGKLVEVKISSDQGGHKQAPLLKIGPAVVDPASVLAVIMVQENHPSGEQTTDLSLMLRDDELMLVKGYAGWDETYQLGKAVAKILGHELKQTSVANSIADGAM